APPQQIATGVPCRIRNLLQRVRVQPARVIYCHPTSFRERTDLTDIHSEGPDARKQLHASAVEQRDQHCGHRSELSGGLRPALERLAGITGYSQLGGRRELQWNERHPPHPSTCPERAHLG